MLIYRGSFSILHVCGGDPLRLSRVTFLGFSILHVCGGDPFGVFFTSHNINVFSTYVEVILSWLMKLQTVKGILHVCGGDPGGMTRIHPHEMYSPRMWR